MQTTFVTSSKNEVTPQGPSTEPAWLREPTFQDLREFSVWLSLQTASTRQIRDYCVDEIGRLAENAASAWERAAEIERQVGKSRTTLYAEYFDARRALEEATKQAADWKKCAEARHGNIQIIERQLVKFARQAADLQNALLDRDKDLVVTKVLLAAALRRERAARRAKAKPSKCFMPVGPLMLAAKAKRKGRR